VGGPVVAQLMTIFRQLNQPVELFIYTEDLHVKNKPVRRYEFYRRNVDWLSFWLRDEEDPDPAKDEQHKRWREALQQTPSTSADKPISSSTTPNWLTLLRDEESHSYIGHTSIGSRLRR
jgi:hypothetical protein